MSHDQEIRRLASELKDLQTRYQAALRKALDSEQQANNNTVTTQNRTLGTLQAAASALANLAAQQSRAEAEGLQTQINLKQSQLTMAQTTAYSLVPTALPPGCGVNRTSPTTGASIREEVEKIRSGRYAPMPPAQRATVNALVVSGRTTMTVKNSTAYELSVFFDGPVSMKLTIMPGASQDVDLAPGAFHVAGRVTAANVLPFYDDDTYAGSTRYSITFYIAL